MLNYTQAIEALKAIEQPTIEKLQALVREVSFEVSRASLSATTIFYSRSLSGLPA